MTGPREWRHAGDCPFRRWAPIWHPCTCGLSAVRDTIAAGHRVVIGPDGVEGRLEKAGDHGHKKRCYRIVPLEEP